MTPEQLHVRDEVLQVLYWLEGERLGDEATARQLSLWIGAEMAQLEHLLGRLVQSGWLEPGGSAKSYRLTELGRTEGKRRFADAFADHGLGWGGPGSCGPDCEDCLIHGPENCHAHGQERRP
jgi:hypothetical protein